MVAQASSAGGDRAPKRVRITFAVTIDVTVEEVPEQPAKTAACQHADASEPCECHKVAAPEATTAPVEAVTVSTIEWQPKPGLGSVSADRRFEIDQPIGQTRFIARDLWAGELSGFTTLSGAIGWCEGREIAPAIMWGEDRSGFIDKGELFRVIRDSGRFHGVDCRLHYTHALRKSPSFLLSETAMRWCEVRAACRVEGGGAVATLHYAAPSKPQS